MWFDYGTKCSVGIGVTEGFGHFYHPNLNPNPISQYQMSVKVEGKVIPTNLNSPNMSIWMTSKIRVGNIPTPTPNFT